MSESTTTDTIPNKKRFTRNGALAVMTAMALAACGASSPKRSTTETVAGDGPVATAAGGHNDQSSKPTITTTPKTPHTTPAAEASPASSDGVDQMFREHPLAEIAYTVPAGVTVLKAADNYPGLKFALRTMEEDGVTGASTEAFNQAVRDGVVYFTDNDNSGGPNPKVSPDFRPDHLMSAQMHTNPSPEGS